MWIKLESYYKNIWECLSYKKIMDLFFFFSMWTTSKLMFLFLFFFSGFKSKTGDLGHMEICSMILTSQELTFCFPVFSPEVTLSPGYSLWVFLIPWSYPQFVIWWSTLLSCFFVSGLFNWYFVAMWYGCYDLCPSDFRICAVFMKLAQEFRFILVCLSVLAHTAIQILV